MTDKPDRNTAELMAKLGQERQTARDDLVSELRLRSWAIEQAVKHGGDDPAGVARQFFQFLTEKPHGGEKAQD
jgi:hypothetical protein